MSLPSSVARHPSPVTRCPSRVGWRLTLVALVVLVSLPALAWGEVTPVDAKVMLEKGDYDEAAAAYGEILAEQGHHPDVYYNLGVAHLGAERWPQAILALERSLALSPGASDAEQALRDARESLKRDLLSASTERKITQGEAQAFVWWRFFHWLDPFWISLALLIAWSMVFISLAIRRIAEHPAVRDSLMVLAVLCGLVSLAAAGYLVGHHQTDEIRPAIVTTKRPMLHDGPTALAETKREDDLYQGALVQVVAEQDGWLQIELADGTAGWLPTTSVADIRVDRWPPGNVGDEPIRQAGTP